jgi:hypothetical protein
MDGGFKYEIRRSNDNGLVAFIPKIDNSKTPNDFGFHKKSFSIVFTENELKKLSKVNIEKHILEISEKDIMFRLEKENKTSIETLILPGKKHDSDKKAKEADEKDVIIAAINDEKNKAEKESGKDIINIGKTGSGGKSFYDRPESDIYSAHSAVYSRFMQSYIYDDQNKSAGGPEAYSELHSKPKREFKNGDELISYQERINYVKAVMMNSLMHSPMNHAKPEDKERYEFWKMTSKFNQQLSFFYNDTITM